MKHVTLGRAVAYEPSYRRYCQGGGVLITLGLRIAAWFCFSGLQSVLHDMTLQYALIIKY